MRLLAVIAFVIVLSEQKPFGQKSILNKLKRRDVHGFN